MKNTVLFAAGLLSLLPAALMAGDDRPTMGVCQGLQENNVKIEFFNDTGQAEAIVAGLLQNGPHKSKVLRIDKFWNITGSSGWHVNIKTPTVLNKLEGGSNSVELVLRIEHRQAFVSAVVYEVDGGKEFVKKVIPPIEVQCLIR
ncbi:hypothetical protein [Leisingera sp. JC11]|uniref:hypothetical protein n=1 Tax=Leisingera sp. JC11 TaxID=3042469 RepID=UPI0034549B54